MPKNGNRGANTKKSDTTVASNNKGMDSNVVFGDSKTSRKAKQGNAADESAKKGRDVDVVPTSGKDLPKKPDTRKLVSSTPKSLDHRCRES